MTRTSIFAATAALFAVQMSIAGEPRHSWSFDIDISRSELTDSKPSWNEGTLRAAYTLDDGTALSLAAELSERFKLFDTYLEARADSKITDGSHIYASLGGTPDADFRAEIAAGLGSTIRLYKDGEGLEALVATIDTRYQVFAAGDVESANPGLELYALKGHLWLTAKHINIWDERGAHRTGYSARFDIAPEETYAFFIGHAAAPDTSEGVTYDTQSWFAGLRIDLSNSITLRAAISEELRNTLYDRRTMSLSLTFKG